MQCFGWKTLREGQLGRPRHRWDYNIRATYGNRVGRCGLDVSSSG
jgi:hypothetical protein